MPKRGQMTLLIILGLLVVTLVGTTYYFREELFMSEFERSRAESLTVPEQAQELHDYISSCVDDVVTEPVLLMGQQGGYLTIPSDPIGTGNHNPFSNALEIFSGTDFRTAYWFYVAANGVQKEQIPGIEEMEAELATYVNTHLTTCADDPALYEQYGATVGEVFTTVSIEDDQVQFVVDYPVHIELEDFSFDFPSFYATVDVPLGTMYDTAVEIQKEENSNYYLEELTYDMFVLNEELPFSWSEISCDTEKWAVEDVETSLRNILMNNILAVKIRNTEYDISEESDRNYFEWTALDASSPYRANLLYSENWPLSMQVAPLQGGYLVEDSYTSTGALSGVLKSLFCLKSYQFIYDVKYPVLISLYDEQSDYTFQWATMVVLDNNQPRERTEEVLDLGDVGAPICDDATMPITVYPVEVAEDGSLVDMADVVVSFQCINSLCPLGETRGSGLEAVVPQCVNAQIIAEKEGYARGVEVVSTLEEQTVTVVLETYYNLTYDLQIVDQYGNTRAVERDETVFVTITEEDTGYQTFVSAPDGPETVLLIPGTYTVEGTMVSDSPVDVLIPADSYTTCTDVPLLSIGGLFGTEDDASCTDVQIDEVEIESAITGAADLTWVVDRDELGLASHVTFYVSSPGEPEDTDDLEEIYSYLDAGLGLREPELS